VVEEQVKAAVEVDEKMPQTAEERYQNLMY